MNRRKSQNRLRNVTTAATSIPRPRGSLRAWREHHRLSLLASLQRLRARPLASALTLAVLSFALVLPLLFWLLLDNARALSGGVQDARAISAFLKPQVSAAMTDEIARRVRGRSDVAAVEIKSSEQGLEEFRNRSGFADALRVLHYNPLPVVLVVIPRGLAEDATPALVSELQNDPAVDLVQYDAQWRQRLNAILAAVRRVAIVVAVLLALAALLVIGNTVGLDIQSRRGEIEVMQLLGASDGFVRRPFLYGGFWYGVFAGVLALMVIAVVEGALAAPLTQLAVSYGDRFAFRGISVAAMAVVVLASALLGWIGAWFATSRHLASGQPR
jgi:cell division transport system permease protein